MEEKIELQNISNENNQFLKQRCDDIFTENISLYQQIEGLKSKINQLEIENSKNLKYKNRCEAISVENQRLYQQIEDIQLEMNEKKNEIDSQKEVISVLEEEYAKSKAAEQKRYKDRLSSLEEMVASYHDRNEVNFA